MNKSHLLNIVKLAHQYYKLAYIKYAEDIIEEQYVSPYHNEFETEYSFRSEKPDEQLMSNEGKSNLLEFKEFEKHYAKTSLKYRLIHTNYVFGLKAPVTVDEYKTMIANWINDPKNIDSKKEGIDLLKNFDRIFGKDAINIMVYKWESDDNSTPEAIDHDISHTILNNKFVDIYLSIKSRFKEAFIKDYTVFKESKDSGLTSVSDQEANSVIGKIFNIEGENSASINFFHAIITRKKLPKGISNLNISKGEIVDLVADLLPIYNQNSESLEGLEFTGINLFFKENDLYGRSDSNFWAKVHWYCLIPKDSSLPNINPVIKEYLQLAQLAIKDKLSSLVGKVFPLWYNLANKK